MTISPGAYLLEDGCRLPDDGSVVVGVYSVQFQPGDIHEVCPPQDDAPFVLADGCCRDPCLLDQIAYGYRWLAGIGEGAPSGLFPRSEGDDVLAGAHHGVGDGGDGGASAQDLGVGYTHRRPTMKAANSGGVT